MCLIAQSSQVYLRSKKHVVEAWKVVYKDCVGNTITPYMEVCLDVNIWLRARIFSGAVPEPTLLFNKTGSEYVSVSTSCDVQEGLTQVYGGVFHAYLHRKDAVKYWPTRNGVGVVRVFLRGVVARNKRAICAKEMFIPR